MTPGRCAVLFLPAEDVPPIARQFCEPVPRLEDADAVVLRPGAPAEAMEALRGAGWGGRVPVIAWGTAWPWSDHRLGDGGASDLEAALASAAEVAGRATKVPTEVRRAAETDAYLRLLLWLWMRGAAPTRLEAGFPLGLGLACERVAERPAGLLDDLVQAGYVTRTFAEAAHPCPACGGVQAVLRDVCPACGSADIVEETLLHHFRCGYQAPEADFAAQGRFVCPKCRRELRHIGGDYDRPGVVTRCRACGVLSEETEVGGLCLIDGHRFTMAETARRTYHTYALSEAGTEALFAGRLRLHDPRQILSGLLQLVPLETLSGLARRLEALGQRHAFSSTVLSLRFDDTLPAEERSALARQVGEEVARTLRQEDAVAYHLSTLYILLSGAGADQRDAARARLLDALAGAFEPHVLDSLEADVCAVADFLDGDGGDGGEGGEGGDDA